MNSYQKRWNVQTNIRRTLSFAIRKIPTMLTIHIVPFKTFYWHTATKSKTYIFIPLPQESIPFPSSFTISSHIPPVYTYNLQYYCIKHSKLRDSLFFYTNILEYDTHTSVLHKTSFISDNHHRNRRRHVPFPTYKHLLTNICE